MPSRPGVTRVSVTSVPDPAVLHPAVSTSNPGLPTRFVGCGGGLTTICAVSLSEPAPFVTVRVAVYVAGVV